MLVSCKTLSDAVSSATKTYLDTSILPMTNQDLLFLQMGIRDYQTSYTAWPTDTHQLRSFLVNPDSISSPFEHYDYISLNNELDSLNATYRLHYSIEDSNNYRMLEGGFTMFMQADTAIMVKHYLVQCETSDGQILGHPKGWKWVVTWAIEKNSP